MGSLEISNRPRRSSFTSRRNSMRMEKKSLMKSPNLRKERRSPTKAM